MQTMLRVYADAQSRQSHCCSHIHSINVDKSVRLQYQSNGHIYIKVSGADPEFLERGFLCIKVWVFALLIYLIFSQISHENEIIWSHRGQINSFS